MLEILVINYSQTGQLDEIISSITAPLRHHNICRIKVEPQVPFPFPWDSDSFFDCMPECVLEKPIALQPFSIPQKKFDLIIFGYQPWFLSPSLPATSILHTEEVRQLIKNTPVVTVIGSRNMWINSQESVIREIYDAGGFIAANIALGDKTNNFVSALTILHWMLKGKKDKMWGILPEPGISAEDIKNSHVFGEIILDSIDKNELSNLQNRIVSTGKITISPSIIFIEERAKMLFRIWANIITKRGTTPKKRMFFVRSFKYYLVVALFFVAPILLSIYFLLIYPFSRKKMAVKRELYLKGIINEKNAGRLHYANCEVFA